MRRRIAAPEERCEQQLGQQAIWKAKRLGRPVETQCSRVRLADSSFCLWHQPDRVETKRHLSNEQAISIYAEVVRLRLEVGPPPIGHVWWWGDGTERAVVRGKVPTLTEFATAHDISVFGLTNLLQGKQYRSIGKLRDGQHQWRHWRLEEVVGACLWFRRELGGIPRAKDLERLAAQHPGQVPRAPILIRLFRGYHRVPLITGIPSLARSRDWDEHEDEYLMDQAGLLPQQEIARTLGRSVASLKTRMQKLGITIYNAQGYLTATEAAREYRLWHTTILSAVNAGQLPARTVQSNGSRRYVFLDPIDIEAWLERRRGGLLLAGGSE